MDWLWLNNTSLFENSADSAFSNAIYPNGDVILNFSRCHFLRKERTSNVLQTVHWLHQQRISNFSKETSTFESDYKQKFNFIIKGGCQFSANTKQFQEVRTYRWSDEVCIFFFSYQTLGCRFLQIYRSNITYYELWKAGIINIQRVKKNEKKCIYCQKNCITNLLSLEC